MNNYKFFFKTFFLCYSLVFSMIPDKRIVAEWEPALGTMIRWPLGIPYDLVVELANDEKLYVLVENNSQENQARNSFDSWGVNLENLVFIYTSTYSHWTRDHGPQFLIGENHWEVVNQQFNGYPVESGCEVVQEYCSDSMILYDCAGTEFCNNQPEYASEGYDCYVNNESCQDFNNDGIIVDWIGDGYCDDGNWGLDFMCDQYSWDCADCGGEVSDENGYCDDSLMLGSRLEAYERLSLNVRGWEEDDDTNIDFADQLNWDVLDIPIYWTGGNFMTDGYGAGFSTKLMINENNMSEQDFSNVVNEYLSLNTYYILDNPNEESIQHIDCLAKLVSPEKIIIKQVPESSPEYDCIEEFADSFYEMNTFYDRPYEIHRLFCPEINGGSWETNPVAAYTNSLILNDKVLVPQYGIPEDGQAMQTYQSAMPGYEIIGFNGSVASPWFSEDALHCRAMGIFDPNMMHISHKSIRSNEIVDNSSIVIIAEVVDYGNYPIESVFLNWKYSAEDGPFSQIQLNIEYDNVYYADFPSLSSNSEVDYYVSALNVNGDIISHPNTGWHVFRTLDVILGDINQDTLINVQDVVLVVSLVLSNNYNITADFNFDEVIDVLDVVQIINIILN